MKTVRSRRRRPVRRLASALLAVMVAVSLGPVVVAPSAGAGAAKWECALTEPFLTVVVGHEAVMWWGADLSPTRQRILGQRSTAAALTLTLAKPPVGPIPPEATTLVIRNTPGGDGMSDRTFDRTFEVGSPAKLIGGCEEIPGHHTLHEVVGVGSDDVLNVRNAPSASGRRVATVPPGGLVWESGLRKRSGSWVPVSVVDWPSGERGRAVLRSGWVHGRYLRAVGV